MKNNGPFFAVGLLAGIVLLGGAPAPPAATAPAEPEIDTVNELRKENTDFALRLYRGLAGGTGNLFCSPHSISTALAMTWAGARGETEREMAGALGFTMGQARTHAAFTELVKGLDRAAGSGGVTLRTANALWPQQGFEFAAPFLDTVRGHYDAELRSLDFAGATESARRTINDWVERKTEERIRELIKPGVLNAATRMVLTNAIYFKGKWKYTFDEKATRDQPFTLSSGERIKAPLMYLEEKVNYGESPGLQLLRLPYGDGPLSMVLLLPSAADGLARLEQQLGADMLDRWLAGMGRRNVEIFIPRFRMERQFQLNQALAELGMKQAFSTAADFSGMADKRLFLSAVIHQAFVEVSEEGTEAAAATGAVMELTSMPVPPTVFRADHPFIFLIMGPEDEILFIGRVTDPR